MLKFPQAQIEDIRDYEKGQEKKYVYLRAERLEWWWCQWKKTILYPFYQGGKLGINQWPFNELTARYLTNLYSENGRFERAFML